jgi:hypothetical protein
VAVHTYGSGHKVLQEFTQDSVLLQRALENLPIYGSGKTLLSEALRQALDYHQGSLRFGDVVILVALGFFFRSEVPALPSLQERLARSAVRLLLWRQQGIGSAQAIEFEESIRFLQNLGAISLPSVINSRGGSSERLWTFDPQDVARTASFSQQLVQLYYRFELQVHASVDARARLSIELHDLPGMSAKDFALFYPRTCSQRVASSADFSSPL